MQKISIVLGVLLIGILLFGCTAQNSCAQCTDWSTCTYNGTQTRMCNDSCNNSSGKSLESQNCEYIPTKCSDGTAYSECSPVRPYQCVKGLLIENISKCGCPEGYIASNDACKLKICQDGTSYGQCSSTQPFYCSEGYLINKTNLCGCPTGFRIYNFTCIRKASCLDGTLEPECSNDKPYQCLNGLLIKKSSVCGCPYSQNNDIISQGDGCIDLSETNLYKPDIAGLELKIHSLINIQRLNEGLNWLSFNDTLASFARNYSGTRFRSYINPSLYLALPEGFSCAREPVWWNSLKMYMYNYEIEPSQGWLSSDEIASQIVNSWMNNSDARQNILTRDYTKEGIGVNITDEGEVYVTGEFC